MVLSTKETIRLLLQNDPSSEIRSAPITQNHGRLFTFYSAMSWPHGHYTFIRSLCQNWTIRVFICYYLTNGRNGLFRNQPTSFLSVSNRTIYSKVIASNSWVSMDDFSWFVCDYLNDGKKSLCTVNLPNCRRLLVERLCRNID